MCTNTQLLCLCTLVDVFYLRRFGAVFTGVRRFFAAFGFRAFRFFLAGFGGEIITTGAAFRGLLRAFWGRDRGFTGLAAFRAGAVALVLSGDCLRGSVRARGADMGVRGLCSREAGSVATEIGAA